MKSVLIFLFFLLGVLVLFSCSKNPIIPPGNNEKNTTNKDTLFITANNLTVPTGTTVIFKVSSKFKTNLTSLSKFYVDGNPITDSSNTFNTSGTFSVFAKYDTLTSKSITINVTPVATIAGYMNHVLLQDFTGTWCGYCPRVANALDLVNQKTAQVIEMQIHGDASITVLDPYTCNDGNNLLGYYNVSSFPTAFINGSTLWKVPQNQNINQVLNLIQPSSSAGLAINSTLNVNNLSVTIKVDYAQAQSGDVYLFVDLVEDNLVNSQENYYTTSSGLLYGGKNPIPNFIYNGVLRAAINSTQGDNIGSSGSSNIKTYSITIPTNVSNTNNLKIIAYIANSSRSVGTVINSQEAKVGENKDFETIYKNP